MNRPPSANLYESSTHVHTTYVQTHPRAPISASPTENHERRKRKDLLVDGSGPLAREGPPRGDNCPDGSTRVDSGMAVGGGAVGQLLELEMPSAESSPASVVPPYPGLCPLSWDSQRTRPSERV